MGSLTNFAETELLDHVFNASYTPPTNLYLALCTADPTDAATGASCNEVADSGSYARKEITVGAAASRRVTQDALVTYDQATGSWGTVTHWVIVDSVTHGAGNALAHGQFAASKAISTGNTASVASTEVYVEFSAAGISDFLANELLDHMFNNAAYSKPATYVALTTATIADGDTTLSGKEVADAGAYARVQVNINGGASPTWDLAVSGDPSYVDNTHQIDFATATVAWGTVVAVAICDSGSHNGGNMLFYDNSPADQAVGVGDTAYIAAGSLDAQMS